MKLIGKWRDIKRDEGKYNEEREVILYVFDNPKVRDYDTGFKGVHPNGCDYKGFVVHNNELRCVGNYGKGFSVGIHKDLLFCLSEDNLEEIAEKLDIEEKHVKGMFSN